MILQVAILIFLYMTLIFVIAQFLGDNSIVDVFWGPGFVVIAAFTLIYSPDYDLRKLIVSFLIFLWGTRLALHILMRNKGKGEDFRYKQWRETWKHFLLRSYLQIFMLQGFFMLIIAAPIYYINAAPPEPLGLTDSIGLFLFGTGFFFEVIGDYQLAAFKKNGANKGKIMTTGLWELTRHPNYFGEALLWWGIGFYALAIPYGWITLISPVAITLLLRYISGVPMLEKKYEGRSDWEEYKSRTAAFIPFVKFF
jgi:steroid 5-alpha reductase family enzyme